MKSCSIEYEPATECNNQILSYRQQSNRSTFSTVVINLPNYPANVEQRTYCFVVTADNGTHTTKIEGSFFSGTLLATNFYDINVYGNVVSSRL